MTGRTDVSGAIERALHTVSSRAVHRPMLDLVAPLDDGLVGSSSGPTAPPIGFHVWHSARWADVIRADLTEAEPFRRRGFDPSEELWFAGGWGRRFGRSDAGPGLRGTGMEAAPDELSGLPFGDKDLVHGYASAAFAALDDLTARLDEELLASRFTNPYGYESSVAFMVVAHISHIGRHLGSIEALVGLSGRPGTASV